MTFDPRYKSAKGPTTRGRPRESIRDRLDRHSRRVGDHVIWTGATNGEYGVLGFYRKPELAHRLNWEDLVGPIPEGHELHHTCDRKDCIAIAHLECVPTAYHKLLHFADQVKEVLSPDDLREATRLHRSGLSLRRVAAELGRQGVHVDHRRIRREMIHAGVYEPHRVGGYYKDA